MNNQIVLHCEELTRQFTDGERVIKVLEGIDLKLMAGQSLAVIGASGSGKTTLLQLLGGLDTPSSGSVSICGNNLSAVSELKRGDLRNRYLGFVYQFHHLLPEFSALENVAMPLLIRREKSEVAFAAAKDILEQVGLGHRLTHKPGMLSGGERQRAAIARALVTKPALLLADEPTGNLDSDTGEAVMQLLLDLKNTIGTSMVIVTHDMQVASKMDKTLKLDHGKLESL
ncbi:MAG: lipoprotein-releasing ABC transporter ATP-binding protein LolD [Gammaproteobacteria bacterium]|nr:lipoprotein-releasing ABC transporter ATP-binding protein LolD [Gammaproteobacteria bacterium]